MLFGKWLEAVVGPPRGIWWPDSIGWKLFGGYIYSIESSAWECCCQFGNPYSIEARISKIFVYRITDRLYPVPAPTSIMRRLFLSVGILGCKRSPVNAFIHRWLKFNLCILISRGASIPRFLTFYLVEASVLRFRG